jgi:glycosyltransferase involved in cell wall biosynthesis
VAELAQRAPSQTAPRLAGLRRVAILPARNEADCIAGVLDELRAFDPELEVVVVDDGSVDRTAEIAAARGATVLRHPFNLGIGGAVQTGFRYALEEGFDVALRLDSDGQHDPAELPKLLVPLLAGEADIVVGSRFAGDDRSYRPPFARRIGIRVFAAVVSLLVRQRVTDTTSGFQAVNRLGIRLFASDLPHDYPEVEATVMVVRHKLRLAEVPVLMRERAGGRSSITAVGSVYYMVKVSLALFVGLFRRSVVPLEEERER